MGVWLVSLDSTPIEGWLVFLQSRFHFRQSLTQCKSSVWKLKYREVIRVRWEFDWYLLIRLRLKVDWYFCNPDSTFGNLRHSASTGRWLHSYWSLIGISCIKSNHDCISDWNFTDWTFSNQSPSLFPHFFPLFFKVFLQSFSNWSKIWSHFFHHQSKKNLRLENDGLLIGLIFAGLH